MAFHRLLLTLLRGRRTDTPLAINERGGGGRKKSNRRMEFKYRQFTVRQDNAAMKVGTDSDLLGTLAEGGSRILDIGTGTGIIALMMAQRCPEAQVVAIEIDENAVKDACENFRSSPFADRIVLRHTSFQGYLKAEDDGAAPQFDCVVCNPPYFDKSTECPDRGRTRARHSSSLPFSVLASGAYKMLTEGGVFSVCIPPEVLSAFRAECLFAGFCERRIYSIKSLPGKPPKRYVLVFGKGKAEAPISETFCMRNSDGSISDWYRWQMKEFHDSHH